ncbi:alkaline phosphatase [Domibacillus robiginosus]|uniref:alkaline phosphatase n=1 Tax=Domibacillus robiginosus TaxID=1071054 RepID=UPI00067D1124|nr:alkaline phosphatase [Domibacillus robiginosus]
MKKRSAGIAALSVAAMAAFTFGTTSNLDVKADSESNNRKAKNVIFINGDGMGAAQREAIRLATVGKYGQLAMDDMPHVGMVNTSSANALVTDSAAAGTAFATGVKTNNGTIGVDTNGKPVKSSLEVAKDAGKATGLVTTAQVTDATPAAFGAHVVNRNAQSDIAKQYIENSKIDVILGGGEDYWFPAGNPGSHPDNPTEDTSEASKGTNGNLVEQAKNSGYTYVTNVEEMKSAKGEKLLGLFANEEMFQQKPEGQGDLYNPPVSLADMTQKAIDTLSEDKNGFFLVVEEEAIDEMPHNNNGELTLKAGKELDNAVAVAKEYAKKHPDTLVIVAGDHETGGLTIEDAGNKDESGDAISKEDGPFNIANSNEQFVMDWTTTNHTSTPTPLTAMGPGAELLAGVYENTYLHDAMIKAMNLTKKDTDSNK